MPPSSRQVYYIYYVTVFMNEPGMCDVNRPANHRPAWRYHWGADGSDWLSAPASVRPRSRSLCPALENVDSVTSASWIKLSFPGVYVIVAGAFSKLTRVIKIQVGDLITIDRFLYEFIGISVILNCRCLGRYTILDP